MVTGVQLDMGIGMASEIGTTCTLAVGTNLGESSSFSPENKEAGVADEATKRGARLSAVLRFRLVGGTRMNDMRSLDRTGMHSFVANET